MDLIGKINGLGVTYLFVKIRYVFEYSTGPLYSQYKGFVLLVQGSCTVSTKPLYKISLFRTIRAISCFSRRVHPLTRASVCFLP